MVQKIGTAVTKLECPNCRAPLEQHAATAQTIVCNTCGTHVAIGMGEPEDLGKGRKAPPAPKPIKIGERATLNDTEYLVLGRVVYRGWSEKERDDVWTWHEWMLGGPNGRMLWLTYDEKGFALYKKARFRGAFDATRDRTLDLGEKKINIQERYPARIIGAEGELTWRAQPGEQLYVAEGQYQNTRYSVQQTAEELEVHEGQPFAEKVIAEAFGNEQWAKQASSTEKNRSALRTAGAVAILFAVASFIVGALAGTTGDEIEPRFLTLSRSQPSQIVELDLPEADRPAIVSVSLDGGSLRENTSADIDVNIVSPDGTTQYLFVQELWHETGRDSDGPWRDTRYESSQMFVPTQSGLHKLELAYDVNSTADNVSVELNVRRNHVMPVWFMIYGVTAMLLGIFLLFLGMRNPHSA